MIAIVKEARIYNYRSWKCGAILIFITIAFYRTKLMFVSNMVTIKSEEVDKPDGDVNIDGALIISMDLTEAFTTNKVSI